MENIQSQSTQTRYDKGNLSLRSSTKRNGAMNSDEPNPLTDELAHLMLQVANNRCKTSFAKLLAPNLNQCLSNHKLPNVSFTIIKY